MPAAVSEGKKRVFDDFPPELLAYICTLVTNNDPTLLGSRGILSSMRLACRAFCRAASRIAHEHVVVSNVDHAKYVLDTILNETKPNRSSMPDGRSQSSYFVPDIRILTICHSGHASSIDLFRVLARLPTAVRRLPNLHTIVWRMPGRPSGDVIRAIAKCTHVKTLELHDTEQVPYRKGDRMSAQLLFPVLTSFVSILNLTLRLDVPRNGEFSPSDKWDSFFSSLTILSRLRSLVIEVAGSHPAPVASICGTNPELNWHDDYTWPDLRCFCVRNAMFAPRARRNAEIVVDFLERHPLLEVLDISGGFGQDHSMNSIGGESEHSSDVLKQVLSEHAKKSPPYRLGNLHTLSIDGERSSSIIEGFLSHGAVLRPIRRIGVLYPPDVARMSDATTNLTRTRADDLLSDYCIGITAAMVHSVFGPDHTTAQVLPTALPYLQELVIMEPMFYTQMEGFVNVLQQWSTKLTQLIQLTVHISQCAGDEEQVKLSAKA
ncbi:hypothetical protein BKA62DRAFT_671909 [Auriculariales sp. MPI-PUGE-AT-0066]|nr:hypothetical protein BKA62DRAFT_671909 [Auriculariales sp. MPI-PUGE-AT-0066]